MLFADFRYDLTETIVRLLEEADLHQINQLFERLQGEAAKKIEQISVPIKSVRYIRYAEMRYRRQEHTIKIRLPETVFDKKGLARIFEDTYKHRFGSSALVAAS
jgi:N-methylhydantoinase A